ncbi:hypothetical protein [Alkalitalea saponilacus]|nr:hypothetical protein [Alkalitalea saponilacus]
MTITIADARSEQVDAPVYAYPIIWNSPVDEASRPKMEKMQ